MWLQLQVKVAQKRTLNIKSTGALSNYGLCQCIRIDVCPQALEPRVSGSEGACHIRTIHLCSQVLTKHKGNEGAEQEESAEGKALLFAGQDSSPLILLIACFAI